MALAPAARPDLAALVAHYRDLLGLRDWAIVAEWSESLPAGTLAQVEPLPTRRLARMLVSSACPPEELRATIAHELIHVLLSPLTAVAEPSGGAVMLEEQAVEALSLAVTRAEASDAPVLQRAFAALPASLRSRLAVAGAPPKPTPRASLSPRTVRARSRMDPELIQKVIEAIKGGDGEAALKMLEEMLVSAAGGEHAEPDGDEPPMAKDEPPPAADAPPPEAKAKDAEPDGEEKYRALGRLAAEALGEKDLVRARGVLAAKLEAAKTADAATTSADAIRRDRAWEKAITSGRARAGQVWQAAILPGGKRGKKPAQWRAKVDAKFPDVRELEGYLETLPRLADPAETQPDEATLDAAADARGKARAAGVTLTDKQIARARRAGIDPDVLAAQVAASMRGQRAAEE